jgi:hypothetical protein
MRKLTARQRSALKRILKAKAEGRCEALSPDLVQQLVRRGLVYKTGDVYERFEWGRRVVGSRLPVVQLAIPVETAQLLVTQEEKTT